MPTMPNEPDWYPVFQVAITKIVRMDGAVESLCISTLQKDIAFLTV